MPVLWRAAHSLLKLRKQVHWLRVILDEGHKVGGAVLTNKLAMAANLRAERRWVGFLPCSVACWHAHHPHRHHPDCATHSQMAAVNIRTCGSGSEACWKLFQELGCLQCCNPTATHKRSWTAVHTIDGF